MLEDFSFADYILGYVIDGPMDHTQILKLQRLILEKLETHSKVSIYLEDRNITKFSLSAASIGALFPLRYASKIDKIALVTNRRWIHLLAALDNSLVKSEIKHFTTNDRVKAVEWISEKSQDNFLKLKS